MREFCGNIAICFLEKATTCLTLTAFEGVSPKKYLKLFLSDSRKKDGARKKYDPKNSKPSIPALLDIRYDYETKVVDNLEDIGFTG